METEDGKSRIILTRPRDQIAAVRALQKIARDGIIPKGSLVLQQNDKPSPPVPLPFPGLDFTRVEATAPDGTTVVVERSDESEDLPVCDRTELRPTAASDLRLQQSEGRPEPSSRLLPDHVVSLFPSTTCRQ